MRNNLFREGAMKCFMSGNECEYISQEDPLNVFVISPFGYPFDDIYNDGIEPLLKDVKYDKITSSCAPYLKKALTMKC